MASASSEDATASQEEVVKIYLDLAGTPGSVVCISGATTQVILKHIPATVTTVDLLKFLAPAWEKVLQMREFKSVESEGYVAWLTFGKIEDAKEFVAHFNGVPFSFLEPDKCSSAFVKKVINLKGNNLGRAKLDRCPICLEGPHSRDIDTTTLLCNHSFHGTCLAKCVELLHCPVCRYSLANESSRNQCVHPDCNAIEGLWMCLICGNLACGRPQWHGDREVIQSRGHALKHFHETGHAFAQHLETQRVWDYRRDRYSSRLAEVTEAVDDLGTKLVEMPGPQGVDELSEVEAKEALSLEYTHLLTTHLETQRERLEQNLVSTQRECEEKVRESERRLDEEMTMLAKVKEHIKEVQKSTAASKRECSKLSDAIESSLKKSLEEKEMTASIETNLKEWGPRYDTELAIMEKKERKLEELLESKQKELEKLFTMLE